jgi:transposase InsO family protein
MLVELSVVEQRYLAVLAVIRDGRSVVEVAAQVGVSRQAVHTWLARCETSGLAGLANRSHRPESCPHQMPAAVEAQVLEWRRVHPGWGPRRLLHELGRAGVAPLPSRSAVYRALVRHGLIVENPRRRRAEKWRRWERGVPMELWQMDVVGGVLLADGTELKALTGVDDHSRFCVVAGLMPRATSRAVSGHFTAALRRHGVPQEILTDNGKVFTGKYSRPQPVEVFFDKICRENGIDHLLTKPASPTTTGKIERFHRSLRAEFLAGRIFADQAEAQADLDAWVELYNTRRPHQGIGMATPAERFALCPAHLI